MVRVSDSVSRAGVVAMVVVLADSLSQRERARVRERTVSASRPSPRPSPATRKREKTSLSACESVHALVYSYLQFFLFLFRDEPSLVPSPSFIIPLDHLAQLAG